MHNFFLFAPYYPFSALIYESRYPLEVLRVQNTSAVASLDPLQRQRRNQRSTHTTAILSSQNLNRILLRTTSSLLGPVEDLAQGLGATGLEVRVLVEDGTIGADVAAGVVLLLTDGGDTAGREAGGAGANKLGEAADEFELAAVAGDVETAVEEVKGLLEVLEGVPGFVSVATEEK
jgi:hypothetical protein